MEERRAVTVGQTVAGKGLFEPNILRKYLSTVTKARILSLKNAVLIGGRFLVTTIHACPLAASLYSQVL